MKAAVNPDNNAAAPAQVNNVTALENSDMGEVKIHENVISSLARRATLEVEGVSRLAGNLLVDNIAEIVGSRRMQDRAIAISLEDNNRVSVEVKINILIGFRLPEVAEKVQRSIINQVEEATGMTVTRVNVLIQQVEEEVDDEEIYQDELPLQH